MAPSSLTRSAIPVYTYKSTDKVLWKEPPQICMNDQLKERESTLCRIREEKKETVFNNSTISILSRPNQGKEREKYSSTREKERNRMLLVDDRHIFISL